MEWDELYKKHGGTKKKKKRYWIVGIIILVIILSIFGLFFFLQPLIEPCPMDNLEERFQCYVGLALENSKKDIDYSLELCDKSSENVSYQESCEIILIYDLARQDKDRALTICEDFKFKKDWCFSMVVDSLKKYDFDFAASVCPKLTDQVVKDSCFSHVAFGAWEVVVDEENYSKEIVLKQFELCNKIVSKNISLGCKQLVFSAVEHYPVDDELIDLLSSFDTSEVADLCKRYGEDEFRGHDDMDLNDCNEFLAQVWAVENIRFAIETCRNLTRDYAAHFCKKRINHFIDLNVDLPNVLIEVNSYCSEGVVNIEIKNNGTEEVPAHDILIDTLHVFDACESNKNSLVGRSLCFDNPCCEWNVSTETCSLSDTAPEECTSDGSTPDECCDINLDVGVTGWYKDATCGVGDTCEYIISPPFGKTIRATVSC